ncbi:tRNA methyltransferase 10 homolog C-like isoform X1 [Biomphalaria glabrata]|uniref:RNA (guanine-9-)-methyltransferase domain-containing protein 1 n=2 Tax=Biomphalaria glabrata TaxID=6526 RepID=A0A9W3A916_BIOGL|nr:tRNA methyltransferase 10 homolog C-like isoform X1 [Biomphalaria glabrata]
MGCSRHNCFSETSTIKKGREANAPKRFPYINIMALTPKQVLGFKCWKYIVHSTSRSETFYTFKNILTNHFTYSSLVTIRLNSAWHGITIPSKIGRKHELLQTVAPCRITRAASIQSHIVADFTQDLNLEELRAESKKDKNNKDARTITKIKEAIAKRCDEAISNLNDENKKKLKVIQLEHNFLYSEGNFIPSEEEMTSENWLEALNLSTKSQRLKYYLFLMKKIQIKKNAKQKALEKGDQKFVSSNPMNSYEHGHIFMRIYESSMKRALNYNLANAMQFGLPLVIDMDYMDYMKPAEVKNTVNQLLTLYSINRADPKMPYHLHFTSCPENHAMYRMLQIELQDNEHFLATVTDKSYLDVFDNEKLVYLSPDARAIMKKFDPEAVYIIGAFNDKATQQPVSFARAKQQGIRAMRLPFDEHVSWNLGGKSITLNQMMEIMSGIKNGVSWKEAIQSAVPRRKIRS